MVKFFFPNINLKDTFECGQCFRWEFDGGYWCGVVSNEYVKVWKDGEYLLIDSEKSESFWKEYFDFDYIPQKNLIGVSIRAYELGKGIRILKQDQWETLISFIISQNNNIPRIKGIISRLCENFGEKIGDYYTFPSAKRLIGKDLSIIRAGFRDKYIQAACEMCYNDFLERITDLSNDELREQLMRIKGVGNKIADCVMLFAYHRLEVFPQDVWIKRIMLEQFKVKEKDIDKYVRESFGENAGYVQQYLYHYFRNLS